MLGRVLRYQPLLGMFVATLAAGGLVGMVCFGVGAFLAVPMLAWLVRQVLRAAERAADDSPGRVGEAPIFGPGLAAIACVACVVAATAVAGLGVGIGLNEALSRLPSWGYPASMAAALGAAAVVGALAAPLAYVPFAASDRELGFGAGIARGLEVARCDSPGGLARMGAAAAVALVAPPVLLGSLELVEKDWGAASLLALGPSLWLAASIVAARYVVARRVAPPKDAARRMPAVVRPAIAVTIGMSAVALVVIGYAATVPAPAPMSGWHQTRPEMGIYRRPSVRVALSESDDAVIPGTYLRVRAIQNGVFVSTPDGGGAGAIVNRDEGGGFVPTQLVAYVRADEVEIGWWLPGTMAQYRAPEDPFAGCRAHLTRSGVRLDDDLVRRVIDRADRALWLGLALWLIGILGLAWAVLRHALDARVLTAADPSRAAPAGGLLAIEGAVAAPRAFESHDGALRLALPAGDAHAAGTVLTLVVPAERLVHGLRDASAPLPRGARVMRGTIDDARTGLARRASRSALVATAFVIAGTVLSIAGLAIALLRE